MLSVERLGCVEWLACSTFGVCICCVLAAIVLARPSASATINRALRSALTPSLTCGGNGEDHRSPECRYSHHSARRTYRAVVIASEIERDLRLRVALRLRICRDLCE